MRKNQYTDRPIIRKITCFIVSLLVLLLCVFSLSSFSISRHAQAAQRNTLERYESIQIAGGDTLWTIAEKYSGRENTADFVKELKVLNGLSSDCIQAGAYLLVPVSSDL